MKGDEEEEDDDEGKESSVDAVTAVELCATVVKGVTVPVS